MARDYHGLLNDNLTGANQILQKEHLEKRIERLAKLYNTKPKADEPATDPQEIVRVNKVYPNVRTALASISAKRPEYLVRPRNEVSVGSASSAELILNYLAAYMKYAREYRHCLTNGRLFHYGVIKFSMAEVNDMTLPSMESWHPLSVRFDPHLEHFYPEEGRWCAFKFKRTLAALRESKNYREKDIDKLAAKHMEKDGDNFSEEKTEIILWEHYLKEGNKILVFTGEFEGSDSTWVREEPFTNVIGLPLRVLTFSPSFDGWFPLSPVEQWIDLQMEYNALFSQLLVHTSRAARKYGYDATRIDEGEKEKFQSAEDGVFIGFRGPPRECVGAIEHAPLSTDIYALNSRIDQLIQEISGIGSLQMGSIPETGSRSATEASIVQTNLQLRSSDNQEIWEEFLESTGQAVLNLAQAHMKGDLWVKISGQMWVPKTRADIVGDMDVRVSAGSTMPTDRRAEWEKAKELYMIAIGNPDFNRKKAENFLLSKQGDIRDVAEWFAPPVPAVQPGMLPEPVGGPPMGGPPMGGPPMEGPMLGSPQGQMQELVQENMEQGATPLEAAADFRGLV